MQKLSLLSVPLVLALLAGCGGEIPDPADSSPPAATSAAPEPTPTAAPVPFKPALADLVLSPHGVGPVKIGHPLPAAEPDVAVALWDETYCDFDEVVPFGSQRVDHGGWKAAYEPSEHSKPAFFLSSTTTESPITHIIVFAPEIRTVEGIGVGSAEAEVISAYPAATTVSVGEGTGISGYVVEATEGTLILWVMEESVFVAEVRRPSADIQFQYEFGDCA